MLRKFIQVIFSVHIFVLLPLTVLWITISLPVLAASVSEPREQYHALAVDITGPIANELDDSPNPFLDIRYDLLVRAPSGKEFTVAGYFAGDGQGGAQGTVWRAKFTPDEPGLWSYTAKLFSGSNAAVLDQTTTLLDITRAQDQTGTINVAANQLATNRGPLRYVGEHYLRFDDGTYWIKGGVDSPENFLGYAGFDNTINQPGGVGEAQMVNGLHHYPNHVSDWNDGDPLFVSQDSGVDSKGIIGAINYLASQGVNSMYFLLMNLGGDGRDTYPFIGATGNDFDNTHYDISKLAQWDTVFEHMQSKGIAVHFVLGEQEEDNQNWLDAGELGTQRKLYYREMAARFAHLHALKWNLSEESRYGDDKHKTFAQSLSSVDWAQHPITVHSFVDGPEKAYTALLGNPLFSASSIQFHAENADEFTETWRQKTREAGRAWVIDMDEVGPGNIGLTSTNSDELRRDVLYPVYFSGGNIEWYFGFQGADIRTEDFRTRQSMYEYMRYAREFMQKHLPFWEMQPADNLLIDAHENDQVFSKPGEVYAVYLNQGNKAPTLSTELGSYTVQWFDPVTGEMHDYVRTVNASALELGVSPSKPQQDWVVLVKRIATNESENETEDNTDNNAGDETDASVDNPDENSGAPPTDATTPVDNTEPSEETTTDVEDIPEIAAAQAADEGGKGAVSYTLLLLCFWLGLLQSRATRRKTISATR